MVRLSEVLSLLMRLVYYRLLCLCMACFPSTQSLRRRRWVLLSLSVIRLLMRKFGVMHTQISWLTPLMKSRMTRPNSVLDMAFLSCVRSLVLLTPLLTKWALKVRYLIMILFVRMLLSPRRFPLFGLKMSMVLC